MREYDLVFIVHPELEDSAFKELIERVKGWITETGGNVAKADIWGKRKLAFPIRKQIEGQYVFMKMQLNPASCSSLERNLRFTEPIIRYLVAAEED